MSDVHNVPLAAIHAYRRAYPRAGVDAERVAVLMDLYAASGPSALPPIDLVDLGDGTYVGADFAHRTTAALRLGWTELPARILPVPDGAEPIDIAYLHALDTATTTAKPLTRAERKAAARRLVADHPDWSDREIARRAGVSHTTVGALRAAEATPAQDTEGDVFVAARAAERASASLARGLLAAWEARGVTDLFLRRMPRTLAAALRERFGDDAPVWAGRLEEWAADARQSLARED